MLAQSETDSELFLAQTDQANIWDDSAWQATLDNWNSAQARWKNRASLNQKQNMAETDR